MKRATLCEVIDTLESVFGDRVRLDETRGRIVCAGIDPTLGDFPDGLWTDVHTINVRVLCERRGMHASCTRINEALIYHTHRQRRSAERRAAS